MNSKKSAAIVAVACGFVSLSLSLPSTAATCTDAKGHKYQCTPKPILIPAKPAPAPVKAAPAPVKAPAVQPKLPAQPILATPAKGQPAQGTQALINQNNAKPAAGIVASGAGNIVASGAGNIVASGAGNAVNRQATSNLVQKRGN